jgi:hypothetical protein
MPQAKVKNLISQLHDTFGDDLTSPQQQQLMDSMKSHVHNWGETEPVDPNFQECVELLLEDVEEQHPAAAGIVREILEVLGNIGI